MTAAGAAAGRRLVGDEHGRAVAVVPPEAWVGAATALRDAGWSFFDLLTVVDEQDAGLDVVLHLWSVARPRVGPAAHPAAGREPRVASLAEVFGGAAWHERQAAEMFGVGFDGHPGLTPLLLPDGFAGRAAAQGLRAGRRVARPWPGRARAGAEQRRGRDRTAQDAAARRPGPGDLGMSA